MKIRANVVALTASYADGAAAAQPAAPIVKSLVRRPGKT